MSEVDDWGIPKQRRPGEPIYGPLPYRGLSFTETYDSGGTELRYFKHLAFAYPDTLHLMSSVKPYKQALLISEDSPMICSPVMSFHLKQVFDNMNELKSAQEGDDGLYPFEDLSNWDWVYK